MDNKEILQKAIKKVIVNGCPYNFIDISVDEWIEHKFYYAVIFSHDFAKAFWGEEKIRYAFPLTYFNKGWKYHLSKMVLEKEPLKYLEKFLNG